MNFVLSILLLALSSFHAVAGDDPTAFSDSPVATNLDGLKEAQDFSKYLIGKEGSEAGKRSFVVVHMGETLPEELQWVVLELEKAGHQVVVKQVTEKQVLFNIEVDAAESKKFYKRMSYDSQELQIVETAKKEHVGILDRAKLYVKKLFGIPKGFTYWFKIKRNAKQIAADASFTAMQMAMAGTSVGLTFYNLSKAPGGEDINYVAASAAIAAWHGLNMFYLNNVVALFGQGRAINKISDDEWKVTKNVALIRTLSFVRSMISNYILMLAAFGPETALSTTSLKVSVVNSFLTLFSRFWFDELSAKKQATIGRDGAVEIKKGQWSPMKMTVIRNVFEVVNGVLKNLHLVGVPGMNWIFPASGAYGLIKTGYQERKDYWPKIKNMFRRAESQACSTLLIEDTADSSSL